MQSAREIAVLLPTERNRNMACSGSQKVLLVLSIIELVLSVLTLLFSVLGFFGGGAIATMSSADLASAGVTAAEAEEAGGALLILSIFGALSAIWGILCGIFGIRAANNNKKIMIVWVFLLIEVILDVVGIVLTVVNGTFEWTSLIDLAVALFMWWIANNIKRQAGK